jgi:hypothetical protein
MTLSDIKDEVAREHGYDDWRSKIYENGDTMMEMLWEKVCDRYAGRWISVEDRKPEYGNWCLLFSWRGVVIGSYFTDRYYVMQLNAPGIQMEIDSVTHWMPLPQPPQS